MVIETVEQCLRRVAELEAELDKAEMRWRNVLEHIPQIGICLDPEGRVAFANRHLLNLTGWTLDEVLGCDWCDLFLPEDIREDVRAVLRETMARRDVGPHSLNTNEIITKDGKRRTISWFNALTLDAAGEVVGMTSLGVDLTAQEEARAALCLSEQRLGLALDASNDAVWDLDCATRMVFVSPQLARHLGYGDNVVEPTYKAWTALVHPDDLPEFETVLWREVELMGAFEHELRIRTAEGGWKWFLVRGKVVRQPTGPGRLRVLGTLLNIHERRMGEEELRRAKMAADLANSALRINMAHLRALMETMPELVWVKDVNGVFLYCNHRFELYYGAPEADIVGRTDYDFVSAEQADSFREHDRLAIEKGGPSTNEETIVYQDGHEEHLETIKTPLYDDDGNLIGVLGMARDITERKRIEDELRESEMRFKVLHNASFGGIMIHRGGIIFDCNQGLLDISGYSREELVGMNGLLLLNEASRDAASEYIKVASEQPYEVVGLRKDGAEYPVRIEARNIPYKGGTARVVEFRDITEQRRAEAELRDSERRHRAIFENSPLGMIRFSDTGHILDCNDRFVEMMGSSRDALIGFHTLSQSDPDMRRALDAAVNGQPSSYEDYYTSVTGGKGSFLHVQFNPVNPGQSPTEVIATLEDFTERQANHEALRQAKEQAEAFSRSKTEFLTNMSHEIRTPLNGIMGMLQLMQSTPLNGEQGEYILAALQSSRRLMNLLSDILDLSRVEAGKLTLRSAPFDLVETCEQVCGLFKLTAAQHHVTLNCLLGETVPRRVVGDAVRLQQVLTNLLGNAFKFTPSGSVTLSAYRLADTPSGGYRILFSVADTGMGIPDDKVDGLFDAFTQVSQGYTREHQGAGLGLAICKNLVSLMGGTMAIESETGHGTSLHVSIPFGADPNAASEAAPAAPRDRSTPGPGTLDILLAEDERVNMLVMRRMLEKAGHRVTCVENGREVLKVLRAARFDVVLMDIQMPVMDGIETARAIRAGEAGPEAVRVPIVAVTAYAMVGDRERFLDAGMDGYVVKPVEANQLRQTLANLCSGRGTGPAGGSDG